MFTRSLRLSTPLARSSVRTFSSSLPTSLRPSSRSSEANPVSRNPANKDFKELGKSAAEEARGVGRAIAEAVAGANDVTSQTAPKEALGAGGMAEEITTLKNTIIAEVPKPAITWGAAGLLPYAGTAAASVHFARQAYIANEGLPNAQFDTETALALLEHTNLLQVQYGSIILSFLGAVHWGFEWAKYGGVKGNPRYLLGVAPVLAGWSTLLLAPSQMALVGQWAAFFGMWYADQQTTSKGWAPRWYSTYRFWLTSVVGGSILLTLAAQGYYSVNVTLAKTETQLKKLKENKRPGEGGVPDAEGKVELGEMTAKKPEDGGAYVQFVNKEKEREKKEEEEKERKEEEEKKKKEEQAEKAKKEKKDSKIEAIKKVEDN
ncbi:DUF3429 domain-containing protein [Sporobolomyces salmoneus]|uniref:DUF3429 domain-containing protein n=1 Tax=Sporobolomyces salmoneus TaxID=183962 RepID=UPI003179652F